jgi:hypothetical protein
MTTNINDDNCNSEHVDTIDFSNVKLPIPILVLKQPIETQRLLYNYLLDMDESHQKTYLIAIEHLGTSFNIIKSNGFQEWLSKQK